MRARSTCSCAGATTAATARSIGTSPRPRSSCSRASSTSGTFIPTARATATAYDALSTGDALAHLERGGPQGGIAFFGCHTDDGRLYELNDENGKPYLDITIE